jgi:DNA modification methylase
MDDMDWVNKCHFGDCLETLRQMPDGIAQTCVTSPPYFGLRSYGGGDAEIGKEKTPDEFVAALVAVFHEVKRVLRSDGTLWLNIGDSYASGGRKSRDSDGKLEQRGMDARPADPKGIKAKDLIGIPWMLAFALRADGWYLRQEVVWAKPNPMPESVTDRCTKSHESIFLLAKSEKYYCDMGAIQEPETMKPQQRLTSLKDNPLNKVHDRPIYRQAEGSTGGGMRNKRSVWTVATTPYKGSHFATFPTALIEPCILAGAPAGGVVLDPFFGSGTTGQVAQNLGRKFIGCELNQAYKDLQDERIQQPSFEFHQD